MVVEEKDLSKETQNGVTAKEPRTYSLESILLCNCPLACNCQCHMFFRNLSLSRY